MNYGLVALLFSLIVSTLALEGVSQEPPPAAWVEVEDDGREGLSPEDLLARYPAGRHWRSVGLVRLDGTYNNRNWLVVSGQVVYLQRTEVECRVVSNRLGRANVEIEIDGFDVSRVLSERQVRLRDFSAEQPMLKFAWSNLEKAAAMAIPYADYVMEAGKVVNSVDPGLQNSLTALTDLFGTGDEFEKGIVVLTRLKSTLGDSDVEIQGRRFEVEYTAGIGVTRIRQTGGELASRSLLTALSRDLEGLVDGDLSSLNNLEVGGAQQVQGADLLPMFGSLGMEIAGGARVTRSPDAEVAGLACRTYRVSGGEFSVSSLRGTESFRVTVSPISSRVHYHAPTATVVLADGTWKTESIRKKPGLLVDAEFRSDLGMATRFETWDEEADNASSD